MSQRTLIAIVMFGWLFCGSVVAQSVEEENRESVRGATPDKTNLPDLTRVSELLVNKTNDFRVKEGQKAVKANEKLVATAQYFAGFMARTDEYGHKADGNGPAQRATKHGYDYCIVLENIAYAYDSRGFTTEQLADELFNGWKNSPEHRKNMLDPDVFDTAVAVARSEKTGYYYAVQMFGRPKSQAIKFEVENNSGEAVSYTIGKRTFNLPPRMIRTHTQCRPPEVKFHWPGGEKTDATVKPAKDDKFVVIKSAGQFAVKKE